MAPLSDAPFVENDGGHAEGWKRASEVGPMAWLGEPKPASRNAPEGMAQDSQWIFAQRLITAETKPNLLASSV